MFASMSIGQINIIKPGGNHILNDSTIYEYGDTANLMTAEFYVINASGIGSLKVYARRDSISWVAGSENYFCWGGTCNFPSVDSSGPCTIGPHDTTNAVNAFFGDYVAQDHIGTTTIRYTFYNSINRSDSSWVIVVFHATPTGIATIAHSAETLSAPYPNPASSMVQFNYKIAQAANLKVYNLLGECVQNTPISSDKNKIAMDVHSMPSGVYLREIEAEGCKPVYQKLIVTH
jgi:hypothetical protein